MHTSPGPDRYGERAETYLRLLAEAALRPAGDSSADPGDRVHRAAQILVNAGVVTDQLAAEVLNDLQLALRVRGRRRLPTASAQLRRVAAIRPPGPFGAPESGTRPPWRVLPAGPATPGARLMALILTADRALAPATLHLPPAFGQPEFSAVPSGELTGTDDLGTSYHLGFTDGTWAGSAWTGTVIFHPAPPAAARWLAISGPNDGELLRADIAGAPAGPQAQRAVLEPVPESPGERLLTREAERMLAALALGYPAGHSEAGIAETVATLEAAGALSPLSPAPARLAALGQLIGLPTQGPADEVPPRWTEVLARYGRRRRQPPVTGTAAIGVLLPELDGARLAIAGLHSGAAGSFLHVIVLGLRPMPRRYPSGPPPDRGFSWWARDDAGGWHLGVVDGISAARGPEALLRLALLPPLGHPTATLAVQVTGVDQQVTADLPVRW